MDVPILIIAIVALVTLRKLLPVWLKHRERVAENAAATRSGDETEIKRLKERLENLETLICRLDEERSNQLEKFVGLSRSGSGNLPPDVTQLPTTYMSVATALEGRYQILSELGRGGMGIVFRADDKQLKEQVAIKILSPLLSNDPDALERLKREVSAARRITHPNVIRIHDISEINGLHFISMEFFSGSSLKDFIRQRGVLSPMQAYNIARQICDGLEAAHTQGVVHRDLKSQNIIINPAGQIKIIDFGLARNAQREGMTATGLIMGTPEYMAPEQVAGKRVDERADIYSLGVILYELFTGHLPFTGDSAIAVGFKQIKDSPTPPRQINPQIVESIEAIILKALQKEPVQRYQSVAELRSDLENAARQRLAVADDPAPLKPSEPIKTVQ